MPWVLIFFLRLLQRVSVGKSYNFTILNIFICEIKNIIQYTWIYDTRVIIYTLIHMSGPIFWNITKVKKIKVLFFSLAMNQLIRGKKANINKHWKEYFSKVSVLGVHANKLNPSSGNVTLSLIIVILSLFLVDSKMFLYIESLQTTQYCVLLQGLQLISCSIIRNALHRKNTQ